MKLLMHFGVLFSSKYSFFLLVYTMFVYIEERSSIKKANMNYKRFAVNPFLDPICVWEKLLLSSELDVILKSFIHLNGIECFESKEEWNV